MRITSHLLLLGVAATLSLQLYLVFRSSAGQITTVQQAECQAVNETLALVNKPALAAELQKNPVALSSAEYQQLKSWFMLELEAQLSKQNTELAKQSAELYDVLVALKVLPVDGQLRAKESVVSDEVLQNQEYALERASALLYSSIELGRLEQESALEIREHLQSMSKDQQFQFLSAFGLAINRGKLDIDDPSFMPF